MRCRHCQAELSVPFIDLGNAPPSNSYLTKDALKGAEAWYPLRTLVCTACWLVQTEDFVRAEQMFDPDYAYFSSMSRSWVAHAERYVHHVTERFGLNAGSHCVEVACNDGYLLQHVKARGIPCLGIEPTASTAAAARRLGIEVVERYFGAALARELVSQGRAADLTAANNVLAHVPDINDFVRGFAVLLKPGGVATFEFPHLMNLVDKNEFDTIYHEHFSYLSLLAVQRIFAKAGLTVFDVEELPTHGGSLRVYAQRGDIGRQPIGSRVAALLAGEKAAGVDSLDYYVAAQGKAEQVKYELLTFLIDCKQKGRTVAGYGAAAKGSTLLNFSGVRTDLLPWIVDRSPGKQGKFMPGSRIPIVAEARIREEKPNLVLILPWNIRDEVMEQLAYVNEWGGRFVTAVPQLTVHEPMLQGSRLANA